jgi:ectoine hydroxylase-related dioxygenase (phytanoyl-CoA dioxygenase family)
MTEWIRQYTERMTDMTDTAATGFAIIPNVLQRDEVAALVMALTAAEMTHPPGQSDTQTHTHSPSQSRRQSHGRSHSRASAGARHLLTHPPVHAVAHDARLLHIAQAFLQRTPVPFRATLFNKSPQSNWLVAWHQDRSLPLRARRDVTGWGPWTVKAGIPYAQAPARALARIIAIRIHLDDSDVDNGPLRVLPGTHTLGVLADDRIAHFTQTREPVDCLVQAGGAIAMRPLLLHASSKAQSTSPRRVLHIEYADSLDMGDGLELAVT